MADAPGTEDATFLAYTILDELLLALVAKGALTEAECVTLLGKVADRLGKDRRAVAQRSVGHVRNAMIREHQLKQ